MRHKAELEPLNTPKAVSDYLADAFATSDPVIITRAMGTVAKGRGIMLVARESRVARENLYRALSGGKNPRLDTVIRVLNTFGLQLAVKPGGADQKRQQARSTSTARPR